VAGVGRGALGLLVLLAVGCGREYHIQGRVVSLPQARGTIREWTGKPLPERGQAVSGALVKIFHELDGEGRAEKDSLFQASTVTDGSGYFDIKDYAVPGRRNRVGLQVSKPGYRTIYDTYWDDSKIEPQVFLITLIPEP